MILTCILRPARLDDTLVVALAALESALASVAKAALLAAIAALLATVVALVVGVPVVPHVLCSTPRRPLSSHVAVAYAMYYAARPRQTW